MVEITGDVGLYNAYVDYLFDLKAQVRTDHHFLIRSGDGGRNTFFTSPRRQADPDTDDTIVDRMNEIDCSVGGSPTGKGLIRIANLNFRTERAVIMRKLVALAGEGCQIEVIVTNAEADILSGLVSAGITVHPWLLRAVTGRAETFVHSKFWLVDAGSTLTGGRQRITYAGSSNWRADQQQSDDLLLRIYDDGVHAAYNEYWELIRSRAASDQRILATDAVVPRSALGARPAANAAGWNDSNVIVRIAGSDGHQRNGVSGLRGVHVEMTGAQAGSWEIEGTTGGYSVREFVISAEGTTTVTFSATDNFGNPEPVNSRVIRIDKTPPVIAGLPTGCNLWPPNNKLVRIADVTAADTLSGIALDPLVTASSDASSDQGDITIAGGSVDVRAQKNTHGRARTYTVRASASVVAGNTATATGTCRVPHSQGKG